MAAKASTSPPEARCISSTSVGAAGAGAAGLRMGARDTESNLVQCTRFRNRIRAAILSCRPFVSQSRENGLEANARSQRQRSPRAVRREVVAALDPTAYRQQHRPELAV